MTGFTTSSGEAAGADTFAAEEYPVDLKITEAGSYTSQ